MAEGPAAQALERARRGSFEAREPAPSALMLNRRPPPRVNGLTNLTNRSIATARGAVFTTVVDDLQMHKIPRLLGKKSFEIAFGFGDVFARA